MTCSPLSFTKFTSITPTLLSKQFSLDGGKLIKTSSADMSEGQAQLMTCANLTEFNDLLSDTTSAQAMTYGIAIGHPNVSIRAADKLRPGDIARTKQYFPFAAAPGILMLDHDSTIDGVPISADEVHERLITAIPELKAAGMLWRPSASSCISNAVTDEVLNGIKGQRLYIAVQDASLIPEVGKLLVERLWSAGMGWVEIGKAGQALKRTLIDQSVFQGNRLDFVGPPELSVDLERKTPTSRYFGNLTEFFDLRNIKPDAEIGRKAQAAQSKAISDAKPALVVARDAHVATTAPLLAARRGISVELAKSIMVGAVTQNVLGGDFELTCQDGTTVTVAELLAQPNKWHGMNFADPLEPDYGGCNRTVARAFLKRGTSPCIRSFAHGGNRYLLKRASRRIQLARGERARVNDAILEALRERGDIYDFGEGLGMARVSGSTAVPVSRDWLSDNIDRTCDFYSIKMSPSGTLSELSQDGPPTAASTIMAKYGDRGLARTLRS